jgi:hypothetical protein
MPKVTNTAKGPRGIRTASGDLVMVEAGQSASGDFSAAEVKDFKAALAFEAGDAAPAAADEDDDESGSDEKPLAKMNKTELLETAAAENITIEDGATNRQIVEAIEAARAANQ